jgi:hypothetical protein
MSVINVSVSSKSRSSMRLNVVFIQEITLAVEERLLHFEMKMVQNY